LRYVESLIRRTEMNESTYVTTQLTSKPLKAHSLISNLIILVGIIMIFNSLEGQGALLAMVGIVWQAITRFRIWWNHK